MYFNIHILRHPLRYRLLRMELERRGMQHIFRPMPLGHRDIPAWLDSRLGWFPAARAPLLAALLFALSAAVAFGLLAPVWLFAVPMGFQGLQPAIVYLAYAPVPFVAGAAAGIRMGGRGGYFACVIAGLAIAYFAFWATGVPTAIVRTITEPQGGGGFSLGGW